MTLSGIKAGDIVLAKRRGWRFYAIALARRERVLEVEPLDRRITYHMVKAREALGIWHKARSRAARVGSQPLTRNGGSAEAEPMRSEPA